MTSTALVFEGVHPDATVRAAVVSRRRRPFGRWFGETGWRHLVALLALAFAVFPVLWVVSAAFSDGTLNRQTLIPEEPTLDNFRTLMSDPNHPPFWSWFRNSMTVGVVTSVAQVFMCACAAYAFSRLRFRGRRPGMLALLLIQMFPNLLAMVAIYLFMLRIKDVFPSFGVGTYWGVVLIYLGASLGVNTWLMKGFFDTIPRELDEAARVDGASHPQIFFRVIIPLAAPVLAVIALLSFIATQSEYLVASVVIGAGADQQQTLAVGLATFVSGNQFESRWGPFDAGALIGAIPVVVLFLFLQRFVVSGLTSGAVKG